MSYSTSQVPPTPPWSLYTVWWSFIILLRSHKDVDEELQTNYPSQNLILGNKKNFSGSTRSCLGRASLGILRRICLVSSRDNHEERERLCSAHAQLEHASARSTQTMLPLKELGLPHRDNHEERACQWFPRAWLEHLEKLCSQVGFSSDFTLTCFEHYNSSQWIQHTQNSIIYNKMC